MQCPACNHEADQVAFGQPLCCPSCGAYYEKALAFKLRKESSIKKEAPVKKVNTGGLRKVDSVLRAAVETITPSAASEHIRPAKFYCTACGQLGDGKRYVPGSLILEIVLWLCFLLPGIIYSVWRLVSAKKACHCCNTPSLIPVNSPRARQELSRHAE